MIRGSTPATDSHGAANCSQPAASLSAIGKFEAVTGAVTVTRGIIVAQAIAGDVIHCGDVIETGVDGLVTLTFADGTRFALSAGTRMEVDEFVASAQRAFDSGIVRIIKGKFAVIAGKLASAGRVVIETPVGQIRSRGPAAGIGSVALGILTFNLVKELQAQGAGPNGLATTSDHIKIDETDLEQGKLTWVPGDPNDFTHGTFVIDTLWGGHFEQGDVTKILTIHPGGSSDSQPISLAQQLAFHNDFLGAKNVSDLFGVDSWGRQFNNQRADLNSNGNGGGGGIVVASNGGGGNNDQQHQVDIINIPHGGPGGGDNPGGSTVNIIPPPPLPPPTLVTAAVQITENQNPTQTSEGSGKVGGVIVGPPGNTVTVTLTVLNGSLSLNELNNSPLPLPTGVTLITGNGTSATPLIVQGEAAAVTNLLNDLNVGLIYALPGPADEGSDVLTVTVTSGSSTTSSSGPIGSPICRSW
jgi:hypothetical protein